MPFCAVSNICDTVIKPFSCNIILSAGVSDHILGKFPMFLCRFPEVFVVPRMPERLETGQDFCFWPDVTFFPFFWSKVKMVIYARAPHIEQDTFSGWLSSLLSSFLDSFCSKLICSPSTVVCGSGICSPPIPKLADILFLATSRLLETVCPSFCLVLRNDVMSVQWSLVIWLVMGRDMNTWLLFAYPRNSLPAQFY